MTHIDDIQRLIFNHTHRLQKLKEQQALAGIFVDPKILIEIEGIEAQIEKLEAELKILKDSGIDKETRREFSEPTEDTTPNKRIQIYLSGDFSSLSDDRRSAAIEAFAAVMGILPQAIAVYRVYEGSIVFDLGIPFHAFQHLRSLLQSNNAQLRLLKVEKVILEGELGKTEEWVIREGKFELVTSKDSIIPMKKQEKVINIGVGAQISAPIVIADSIGNSFNRLTASEVDDEIKRLLDQLLKAVNDVNKQVSPDKADEAKAMARDAEVLVKEVTSSKPRRQWCEVSLEGLKQAAINIGEIAEPVLNIVKKLLPLLLSKVVVD